MAISIERAERTWDTETDNSVRATRTFVVTDATADQVRSGEVTIDPPLPKVFELFPSDEAILYDVRLRDWQIQDIEDTGHTRAIAIYVSGDRVDTTGSRDIIWNKIETTTQTKTVYVDLNGEEIIGGAQVLTPVSTLQGKMSPAIITAAMDTQVRKTNAHDFHGFGPGTVLYTGYDAELIHGFYEYGSVATSSNSRYRVFFKFAVKHDGWFHEEVEKDSEGNIVMGPNGPVINQRPLYESFNFLVLVIGQPISWSIS